MTRATIWAICLIIVGTALCFGALYYLPRAKDNSGYWGSSKKRDYDRRTDRAVISFCLGVVLAAFGAVIGMIQIGRHFLR